jgi:hypothetical protein
LLNKFCLVCFTLLNKLEAFPLPFLAAGWAVFIMSVEEQSQAKLLTVNRFMHVSWPARRSSNHGSNMCSQW